LCNRPAERIGLDVIREPAPAVDLHDGQPLPILGLQSGIAGDVDLTQVEAELLVQPADHLPRPVAQVAAGCVIDDDVDYG